MSDIITYPENGITYDAEDAAGYLATRLSGVYSADEDFSVAVDGDLTVTVSEGQAWVRPARFRGRSIIMEQPATLTLTPADAARSRIDRVVLRYDASAKKTTLTVLEGTPDTDPTAPAISRTALLYDLCLAEIRRAAGSLSVTAADIADTRLDEDLCGVMRDGVTGIPTADLLVQARAQIDTLEETASTSAAAAKRSEQNAAASQKAAASSASTASTKAGEAATSAGEAASSASAAAKSQSAAAGSASTAAVKAEAASGSATAAAGSASAAKESQTAAEEAAKKAGAMVSTDSTLTISGAPADAKVVGDKLSERYTISEVNNLIASSTVETDKTLRVSGAAADAKAAGDAIKAITPASLGLGNVDNTADSDKNVYYASYAGSANSVAWSNVTSRPSTMSNPYSLTIKANGTTQITYDGSATKSVNITKSSIGLGNVDNTADSDKSVYYATSAGSASSVAWTNVSDRPSSLKNPYSLGIQTNGTMLGTYDGSAGKILNITASNVGALESGSSDYVSNVSVSGSTLYITRGDGTYQSFALASDYILPTASSYTLGGVRIGSNITNSSGTISLTKSNVVNALGFTPTNAPYSITYEGCRVGTGTTGSASSPVQISFSQIYDYVYIVRYTTSSYSEARGRWEAFNSLFNGTGALNSWIHMRWLYNNGSWLANGTSNGRVRLCVSGQTPTSSVYARMNGTTFEIYTTYSLNVGENNFNASNYRYYFFGVNDGAGMTAPTED